MSSLDSYVKTVLSRVRNKNACAEIKAELVAHWEDLQAELQREGMPEDAAENRALEMMGDPAQLGRDLDRVHRPQGNRLFFAVVAASVVGGILALNTSVGGELFVAGQVAVALLALPLLAVAPYFNISAWLGKDLHVFAVGEVMLLLAGLGRTIIGTATQPWLLAVGLVLILKAVPGLLVAKEAKRGQIYVPFIPLVTLALIGKLAWVVILATSFLAMLPTAKVSWRRLIKLSLGVGALGSSLFLLVPKYRLASALAWLHPQLEPDGSGYLPLLVRNYLQSSHLLGGGAAANPIPPDLAGGELILAPFVLEMGWALGLILVATLAVVVLFVVLLAQRAPGGKERAFLAGAAAYLGFRIVWNVGMVTGVLPLAGMGLPLVSFSPALFLGDLLLLSLVANTVAWSIEYTKRVES